MTKRITDAMVLDYILEAAESIIEDDMNESGEYTDEEFDELRERAFDMMYELRSN
jgi:hypothetical protein